MITRDEVLRVLSVDLASGRLLWKCPPANHADLKGKEAGAARPCSHNAKAYWVIKIGAKSHKRGRLIFLVAHGRLPTPCLDHINGDSLDDRLVNLREATVTQNAWNHKARKRKSPLPMGVRITAQGRYQARLAVNRKMNCLGTFATVAEAHRVYLAARKQHFGEFA